MKSFLKKIPLWVKIVVPAIIIVAITALIIFSQNFNLKEKTVPDVTGRQLEEAISILEENGLKLYIGGTVVDDSVDENTVISQNPKTGEILTEGDTISVEISCKSKQIIIPDVTDYDSILAKEKLEASGVSVEIKEEYSDTVPAGAVVSQSKAGAGSTADTVTIVISKGNENGSAPADPSKAPNVEGKTKDEAKKILNSKNIQFTVTREEYSDTVEKGVVISQSVSADGKVVTLIISKGNQNDTKVIVPDVVYRTLSDAKAMLEKKDLRVKIIEDISASVPKGAVIKQSVKAGSSVNAGTLIEIVVSTGEEKAAADETVTTIVTTTAPKTTKNNKPFTTKAKTTTSAPKTTSGSSSTKVTTTLIPKTSIDYEKEKQYVADFKITTDKASASKGDTITVSVALKTNYNIFSIMLPVIYDGDVFEVVGKSTTDVSSFLSFEGKLAKTYKTNGTWASTAAMYKRNNNPSYWNTTEVKNRWKIAYATWGVSASLSKTPVKLSDEEVIVTFKLKVKDTATATDGRIFISSDFQKTTESVGGILAVGRCKNDVVDANFVDRDQTIKVNRADVSVKIK